MNNQHPPIHNKTGVLIINLGTPENFDTKSVRKYLKQFLSDRRVIEVNPILWQLILNLIILPFRSKKSAAKYKQIWMHDINRSPLRFYTKAQSARLASLYQNQENILVDYAMRYGNPSIEEKINKLKEKGCRKIIFIPLYPQYSATTTASVTDEIYRIMQKTRWQPEIRIAGSYHDNPIYIQALVNSVSTQLKTLDFVPDAILSSYHGIPKKYTKQGDPYYCFCSKTNRLFSEELVTAGINIPNHFSFQSRFGPKEWLQPYTEDVIKDLIAKGIKNILVITPGFSSDCIETLEEVNMEYRDLFLSLGGQNFVTIPCLNDSDDSVALIDNLVKQNLW